MTTEEVLVRLKEALEEAEYEDGEPLHWSIEKLVRDIERKRYIEGARHA